MPTLLHHRSVSVKGFHMVVYYANVRDILILLLRTHPKTGVALAAPLMKRASPQTVCREKGGKQFSVCEGATLHPQQQCHHREHIF